MVNKENSKKEQILDAAATIFCQKGYHKAKVEEIAKEAQVGKGTVYEYFKSKKDLFGQMIVKYSNTYFKSIEEHLQEVKKISVRLEIILRTHLEFIRDNRKIANIIVAEHHLLGEELHNIFMNLRQEKLRNMQKLIQIGVETGEFRELDTKIVAEVFSGLIFSIGGYFFQQPDLDIDKLVSVAMDIFLGGIRK